MEDPPTPAGADHLCVLVHGLWGNPGHLANVVKALRDKHADERLHILVAKRNSGYFTYDGIECGGERVCQEIEEEIQQLENAGQKIKKLSIVGYSLGGLIARYAIGLLYSRGMFDKVEPVNFTTFASPHLGVRTPGRGWHRRLWNAFGSRTLSMSGKQLFLVDNFRDTGRPILSLLADPDSIFIKGLTLFRRRTLYANIINDRSAVYYTTAVSKIDPYINLEKIKIKYLEGYEDVVLDPLYSFAALEPITSEPTSFYSRLSTQAWAYLNRVPLTIALVIFMPIGAVVFLINSVIQTASSSRRIRLHEAGRAGIEVSSYRIPLLISDMREAVEDAYENLNSRQGNGYLAHGGEEEALNGESPRSSLDKQNGELEKPASSSSSTPSVDSSSRLDPTSRPQSRRPDVPMLALMPDQFAMIESLDNIGWRKYPVHIHKARHSHAAIIVRSNRSGLVEGWAVLRHWLDEEFLMA